MLVDEVEIVVRAGNGGKGAMSFGKTLTSGPDGGNGGDGGDLYIEVVNDLFLLNQFTAIKEVNAGDGGRGGKDKRIGRRGEDFTLKLPVGSTLTIPETGESIELMQVGEKFLFLQGGEHGIGNWELRSSTNTTPRITVPPTPGESRTLRINLRFLADFGLIGLPSSGKSSLLNELTNTNVKTASYHFTTLEPNLGVLPNKKVIADIPGLIEGASDGKGLGIKFLKHIQKVSLLLHCISADSVDPMADYKVIRKELESFDKELISKEEIILITKTDLVDKETLEKVKSELESTGRKMVTTSIHDLASIEKLLELL